MAAAEAVLLVLDASSEDPSAELNEFELTSKTLVVWNKCDLVPERILPELPVPSVRISTLTGENLDALAQAFRQMIWSDGDWNEPDFAVNFRQNEELKVAAAALPEAISLIANSEWELAAIPLRAAIDALGRITGESVDPDILENIFSRFCIGK